MADCCNSQRERFSRRCRMSFAAITAPATTTSATILPRNTCISCRSRCATESLGYAVNGWQVSGTVFWHSGLPFSVLSTPYSAQWRTASCRAPGRSSPALCPGWILTVATAIFPASLSPERFSGSIPMLLYRPWIPAPGPATVATVRQNCQFGDAWPQCLSWSEFLLERLLPDKMVPDSRAGKTPTGCAILQCLQPSQFRASQRRVRRHSREAFHANRIWSAHVHDLAAHRPAGRGLGWRQQSTNDRVAGFGWSSDFPGSTAGVCDNSRPRRYAKP